MCSQTVKKHNLEHELLSPEQVHSRFPGYELPAGYKVARCHVLEAGMLISENVSRWSQLANWSNDMSKNMSKTTECRPVSLRN